MLLYGIAGDGGVVRDEKAFFNWTKNISAIKNSRTTLCNKNATSQLWFLPYGPNQLISSVSKCQKGRMMMNDVLKH